MTDLLTWMKEYSPPLVLLLAAIAALIFILQKTVEKSIEASFELKKKEVELFLNRISVFKDKVLTERYTLIGGLIARLERILTNINRRRGNLPVAESFMRGNEIVPLTEVFEEISIHRLTLGEWYYDQFNKLANITLKLSNTRTESEWSQLGEELVDMRKQLREQADTDFGISTISLKEIV